MRSNDVNDLMKRCQESGKAFYNHNNDQQTTIMPYGVLLPCRSITLLVSVLLATGICRIDCSNRVRQGRDLMTQSIGEAATSVNSDDPVICINQLPTAIDNMLQGAVWNHTQRGVLVQAWNASHNAFSTLYAHDADHFFTPASNNKLPTTTAAYLLLGPQYTHQTKVFASKAAGSGHLSTLCIQTVGDPSITTGSLRQMLQGLAHQLGIAQIDTVQVDDTFFSFDQGTPLPGTWEWDDVSDTDGAQPSAAILDENTWSGTVLPGASVGAPAVITAADPANANALTIVNQITTGAAGQGTSLQAFYKLGDPTLYATGFIAVDADPQAVAASVLLPSQYMANVMSNVLQHELSVSVSGTAVGACPTSGAAEVTVITSEPLSVLMNHTLQVSDNLYAETYMLLLGKLFGDQSPRVGQTGYDTSCYMHLCRAMCEQPYHMLANTTPMCLDCDQVAQQFCPHA